MSAEPSEEDGEVCSNKATSGSSISDTNDFVFVPVLSRSSESVRQRLVTRRFTQALHMAQTDSRASTYPPQGPLSPSGTSFRGLTPPPLPSTMLPSKARPVDEVLRDKTPPKKDKLSAEIDQIAQGGAAEYITQGGTSGTQNVESTDLNRRKRNRTSTKLSTTPEIAPASPPARMPRRHSTRVRDSSR